MAHLARGSFRPKFLVHMDNVECGSNKLDPPSKKLKER